MQLSILKSFFVLLFLCLAIETPIAIAQQSTSNSPSSETSKEFLSSYVSAQATALANKDLSGNFHKEILTPINLMKFRKLAKENNPYASAIVGQFYSTTALQLALNDTVSTGVKEKNPQKAILRASKHFAPACDKNVGQACLMLGSFYANGSFGHEQNSELSERLFAKACRLNSAIACTNIKLSSKATTDIAQETTSKPNIDEIIELVLSTQLNDQLLQLQKQRNYSDAVAFGEKALEIRENILGQEHPLVAQSLHNLGRVYLEINQFSKAELSLHKSLEIIDSFSDEPNEVLAMTLNSLASVYKAQGRYTKAAPLYTRALKINETILGKDHSDVAISLNNLGLLYFQLGQYSDAESVLRRSLDLRKSMFGEFHPDVARSLNHLGSVYQAQGQYARAEPLFKHALDITETVHGKTHPDVVISLNNLALLSQTQGRFVKAEALFLRALNILETAPDQNPLAVATGLNNLAFSYFRQGAFTKAEPLYLRAIRIQENTLGKDHPDLSSTLGNLGLLYTAQWQYTKAEQLHLRALNINETVLGLNHPNVVNNLSNLADVYKAQGEDAKAERLFLRALNITETTLGKNHPTMAGTLNNLGSLYLNQGYNAKAEALFLQGLNITETVLGRNHQDAAQILNNLAFIYMNEHQYSKAEPLLLRALNIKKTTLGDNHPDLAEGLENLAVLQLIQDDFSKAQIPLFQALKIKETAFGKTHPEVALSLNNLAYVYQLQDNHLEAEQLHLQALAIRETAFGQNHPNVAHSLNNLAFLYDSQGKYKKAEPLYTRALKIYKQAHDQNSSQLANAHLNLGMLYKNQNKPDLLNAEFHLRSGTEIFERRAERAVSEDSRTQIAANYEHKNYTIPFYTYARTSHQLALQDSSRHSELLAKSYTASQYALSSEAGVAMRQSASRFAAGDIDLSTLVRKRQDLVTNWGLLSNTLAASISSMDESRDGLVERSSRIKLAEIDDEIVAIDLRLKTDFPNYFTLVSPKPVSLEATQELLYDNEAALMFLTGDEGTLVFAVTKDKVDWAFIDLDSNGLSEAIRVLRVSLESPHTVFPRDHAHGLYKTLMGKVEGIVKEKDHLFIIHSGALGSIPMAALVTESPQGNDLRPSDLRTTSWWGIKQSLTTLPSLSSLQALRRETKNKFASEPFAGFGSPNLDGPKKIEKKSSGIASYFKGKHADLEAVRSLRALPHTRQELVSLAKVLGADPSKSLWLAEKNTELNLKQADLSQKRILAFATHALVSGEISGLSEPALVFTPPLESTDLDDGLLTASEVMLLNLNAEWVILSACNTAMASRPGSEGLSGLAKSFFYAGSKAMLVSHWSIRDDVAARLVTETITMHNAAPHLGRSEGLRRSMVDLMKDTSDPSFAHPSTWASFVIVGEGGYK